MSGRLPIRTDSDVPLFEQIVRAVEAKIMTGLFAEGEFLPSVRECAQENSVNPNTVAKAYQALQANGWVEAVRGTGLRVKKVSAAQVSRRRESLLDEQILLLLRVADSMDIKVPEIVDRIKFLNTRKIKGVS